MCKQSLILFTGVNPWIFLPWHLGMGLAWWWDKALSTELIILVSSFSSLFSFLETDLIICCLQEALGTLRALGKVCGFCCFYEHICEAGCDSCCLVLRQISDVDRLVISLIVCSMQAALGDNEQFKRMWWIVQYCLEPNISSSTPVLGTGKRFK